MIGIPRPPASILAAILGAVFVAPLTAQSLPVDTAEIVWTRGGPAADEAYHWIQMRDASIVGDKVITSDMMTQKVQLYSAATGEPLGTVGGAGQGPGEFVRPSDIDHVGDRTFIADWAQGRYVVLDRDLEVVSTNRMGDVESGVMKLRELREDWILGSIQRT